MKLNKYKHKKTGLVVEAVRYGANKGLEDGFKCDLSGNSKPYKKVATIRGRYQEVFLNEKDYLISRNGYVFVITKRDFLKLYKRYYNKK